jgi:hypothetical protein
MPRKMLAAILFAVAVTVLAPPPASASVSWSVSISYFHESLAPYGRWVDSGSYGEVWVPSGTGSGWDPYWDGEWIWTECGWTWVSSDPWGDIPYHYGTWVWVSSYGWAWEPGTVWAPAWVTWAWTDDYIGWAPVPSTFFITASGYFGPPVVLASTRYVFVPATQFVGTNVSTVSVPQTQNTAILSRAQKGTRFTVSGGVVRATADPPPELRRARHRKAARKGQPRETEGSTDDARRRPHLRQADPRRGARAREVRGDRERQDEYP